ncbi:MAG TPA: single-stranded DNA-binding protein [Acidobacteriaceae bacterium]|jgi:single-strand DNA-binding protein|nr:single-stranded DNA-binding protein [Acidobacteriaceae bacterium]
MARSINKAILVGNVGKDPEVKFLPSGSAVANFSLATSERFKDKSGEFQERTEWHNLVAYDRLAEIVRDYVKKGSKLYVEGRISTRSYDDKTSGQKRYFTEINIRDLVLLSGRGEGGDAGGASRSSTSYDQRPPAHADELVQSTEITDDDIPF